MNALQHIQKYKETLTGTSVVVKKNGVAHISDDLFKLLLWSARLYKRRKRGLYSKKIRTKRKIVALEFITLINKAINEK